MKYLPLNERTPAPIVVSTGKQPLPFSNLGLSHINSITDQLCCQILSVCMSLNSLQHSQNVFSCLKRLICYENTVFTTVDIQSMASYAATIMLAILQMSQTKGYSYLLEKGIPVTDITPNSKVVSSESNKCLIAT